MAGDEITEEMVERAAQAVFEHWQFQQAATASIEWVRGGNSLKQEEARDYARAALAAVAPMIWAKAVEDQRRRCSDPHGADWYWRDLDPDDSGDSITEAIQMMGEGVVCHVRSSFAGPDFFAAIVPVLDKESDDTEELIAETAEECVRLVQERYAAIAAIRALPTGAPND